MRTLLVVIAIAMVAPAVAVAAPADDAEFAKLGLAGPPDLPSKAAGQALAAGQKALAKGDLTKARDQLTAALAASPGLAEARYQLAIIDARSGALAAARDAIIQLCAEDLYQFAPRFDADPGLTALRDGSDGDAVRKRIGELTALYAQAIERGVPAQLFAGTHGDQSVLYARVLRPGVWLDAAHRFFAVTPPIGELRAAYVDVPHHQVVTVAFDVDNCRHDFCPMIARTTVALWPLAQPPAARPATSWSHGGELVHFARIEIDGDGARVQVQDCELAGCKTPWQRLAMTGTRVDADQHRHDNVPALDADYRGAELSLPAAGLAIRGAALDTGAPPALALDRRHRLAGDHCVARAGDQALIASTVDTCDCGSGSEVILQHTISRVDLAGRRSELIATGKGAAAAELGPAGELFLQLGERVTRFASIADVSAADGAGEPLPAGIVLVAPVAPRSNCCGL